MSVVERKEVFMIDKLDIRTARVSRGMTQSTLAEKVGVSKTTIVKWESGEASPTTPNFFTLCEVLNYEPNDIFLKERLTKRKPKRSKRNECSNL